MLLAIRYGLKPLIINMDSLEAILMFSNKHLSLNNLIFEWRFLLEKVKAALPVHMFRVGNRVRDMLAKEGWKMLVKGNLVFLFVPPVFVLPTVNADKLKTKYCWKILVCNINTHGQ